MTAPLRRWLTPVVAALTALTVLAGPLPASAAPNTPAPSGHEGGQPKLLGDLIESTNRSYTQAQARLKKSEQRQVLLNLEVQRAQGALDALAPQVTTIAGQSYRTGRVGAVAMLLDSATPDSFVQRASALDEINMINAKKLAEVRAAKDQALKAKLAIDAEVREQLRIKNELARQKRDAEKALALVGGRGLTRGEVVATSPKARPGPGRDSDGDWKPLGCTESDPTTSGCVTARTLHMYKEVRRVGFDRFVGCYRSGGPYEHPKGRACDWSLQDRGFSRWNTTDELRYGNNLTAFLVRNAEVLGIYYVIWNRQIWFPATGWKSYSGPSDHTDHVHVSML